MTLSIAMSLALLLSAVSLTSAVALPSLNDHHAHSHNVNKRLPGTWYHPPDHQAHRLFKRASGDGVNYPVVGSPTWSSAYPAWSPDVAQLPQAWVDALNAAVADGKIPDIPQSTQAPSRIPAYPSGFNPNNAEVCSGSYGCRIPGDIWDSPDGHFGTGFDDGPQPASAKLYQFLQQNNESATHFMIGVNIIQYPQLFNMAFETLQNDIAVHTWTHPYMTTLNNLQVLGQLGWTMELIHNSTGGRLPRFWRPPYGDSDTRVRAVAKEVFGLETIMWNHDTGDWSLTTGGTTPAKVQASMTTWLTGPKSPGLIVLEHELTDESVQSFIDAYPVINSNGWKMVSVAQIADTADESAWQNADSSSAPVMPLGIIPGSNSTLSTSAAGPTNSEPQNLATSAAPSSSAIPSTNGGVALWTCGSISWALSVLIVSNNRPWVIPGKGVILLMMGVSLKPVIEGWRSKYVEIGGEVLNVQKGEVLLEEY